MENKQEIWHSVTIETKPEAEEAVEFALNQLDSLGNEIDHLGKKDTENLRIVGYFEKKIDDDILQNELSKALKIYGFTSDAIHKTKWQEIENQDWLAEWKEYWKPTETNKFIIAPPWENVENSDKIIIQIEPNMAFGTGTHETTKLCLKAIEEKYSPEMSFYDVGTGTGILAIGIAKTQGKSKHLRVKGKILGCDTDTDSINIARENAELNGVDEIDFYIGSISEDTPNFDFVCANVTADIIIPMLPLLVKKAQKILILSGILVEQEKLIANELEKLGITNFEVQTDGEWISILIKVNI